jgi:RimJ/RimL family protein N-acetyltransferase
MYRYEDGLQSDRLITHFITTDDAESWAPFFASDKATELFPDFGFDTHLETAMFWNSKQQERYANETYGLQNIFLKDTNTFIGQCGLLLQEVDGITELEVGYHMLPAHWGHGYAPEAAKLFIDYAKEQQLAESIISIIDVRNNNSMRVAKKNGLKLDKTTTWREVEVNIFRSPLQ